jgi:hypothetical protein
MTLFNIKAVIGSTNTFQSELVLNSVVEAADFVIACQIMKEEITLWKDEETITSIRYRNVTEEWKAREAQEAALNEELRHRDPEGWFYCDPRSLVGDIPTACKAVWTR